jgi:flagellar hook-associated protein 2
MGTISLDGLVSGLDTTSIINSYVQAAGANLKVLKQHKSDIESKRSLWQTFNGYLSSLKSQIESIASSSDFKKMSVSSANTDKVTAEVTSTALAGTYTVEISQIANSQTSISTTTWASGDTAFSSDSSPMITIVQGSTTSNISIDTNTLDGAIAAINDANIGVSAYKIEDKDGNYVLALTGKETGADNAFTITPPTGVTFPGANAVEAQDTKAVINGVVDVQSSTNQIADALPGITLTAVDTTASAVNIQVTTDTSGIKEQIRAFVDDYNTMMGFINNQVSFNSSTKKGGPLSGDATLRSIENTLQSVIRSTYTSNSIDSLAKIGISTSSDGTLSVDDDELTAAVTDNLSQVVDFFTSDSGLFAAFTNTSDSGKLDFILDTSDGTVQSKLDSLDDQIDDLADHIESEQKRLDKVAETLRKKFTALEVALSALKTTQSYVSSVLGNLNNSKK